MPQHRALVDVGVALGWVASGVAVAIASWQMDRLGELGINPYSVPGLVPGIIGAAIAALGAVLAAREWRAGRAGRAAAGGAVRRAELAKDAEAAGSEGAAQGESSPSIGRAVAAGVLSIVFAGFVLGHGLPFSATSGVFIFLFIMLFGRADLSRDRQGIVRTLAVAALVAATSAAFIAFLFGEVFLVRLP
ncbi:MAG: tripartite tricarboxylate transporter TctB family protein [Gammaproteobacteria bacterium]